MIYGLLGSVSSFKNYRGGGGGGREKFIENHENALLLKFSKLQLFYEGTLMKFRGASEDISKLYQL